MKRILFMLSSLRREGPVIQLLTLVRHLPTDRFEVHVLSLSNSENSSELVDDLSEAFRRAGATLYFEPLRGGRYHLLGWSRVRVLISRLRPDIVQCSGIRADMMGAWLAIKSKPEGSPRVISVMHNIPWEDYRYTYGRAVAWIMLLLQRRAWSRMYAVAAVSKFVRDQVALRWPDVPVHAIPNGVDFRMFRPEPPSVRNNEYVSGASPERAVGLGVTDHNWPQPEPPSARNNEYVSGASPERAVGLVSEVRNSFGLREDEVVLLCTDHLSQLKDPLTLIRGFKMMQDSDVGVPLRLVFAGDGPLLEVCRSEAAELAGVLFSGRTDRVAAWYLVADVLVSASRSEGFHLSVAEGLGCGLVPVLSAIGVRSEFFRGHEGLTNPLLFTVGDAAAAGASMRRAVKLSLLRRRAVGLAGRDSVVGGDGGGGLGGRNSVGVGGDIGFERSEAELLMGFKSLQEDISQRFSAQRMANDYVRLYFPTVGESVGAESDSSESVAD
jgi:glycosyltransferase involved in cell wall biosynthesis